MKIAMSQKCSKYDPQLPQRFEPEIETIDTDTNS